MHATTRTLADYMVQVNGKWRRVYCRIYSNIGTLFVGKSVAEGFIVDIER